MYAIDNSTALASLPIPGVVGPNPGGSFTGGNPATSTPATDVDADWLNAVQWELCNAITGMGGTLSKTNQSQLLGVLQKLALYSKLAIFGYSYNYVTGTSVSTSYSFTPTRDMTLIVTGLLGSGSGLLSSGSPAVLSASGATIENQSVVESSTNGILTAQVKVTSGTPVVLTLTGSGGSSGSLAATINFIGVSTS